MKTTIVLLLSLVLCSCSNMSYKEAPPKDKAALKAFPNQLQGKYYLYTGDENPASVPGITSTDCNEQWDVLEISADRVVIHDLAAPVYTQTDSDFVKTQDNLIYLRQGEEIKSYSYIQCNDQYYVMGKDIGANLVLTDTVVLKQLDAYYFLSFRVGKDLWTALIFTQTGQGMIEWLGTLDLDQESLDKKMSAYTKVEHVGSEGVDIARINPNNKALSKIMKSGIYKPGMSFKKR